MVYKACIPLNAQVLTTLMPAFEMLAKVFEISSSVFKVCSQYALVPMNLKALPLTTNWPPEVEMKLLLPMRLLILLADTMQIVRSIESHSFMNCIALARAKARRQGQFLPSTGSFYSADIIFLIYYRVPEGYFSRSNHVGCFNCSCALLAPQ